MNPSAIVTSNTLFYFAFQKNNSLFAGAGQFPYVVIWVPISSYRDEDLAMITHGHHPSKYYNIMF